MVTKEALHELIESLPEAVLPEAARRLEELRDDPLLRSLIAAPLEDEELSDEELAALAEAEAERAAGAARYVAHEDLRRDLPW